MTSIINLGEAYYRLVRVERREQAESLWRMAHRRTLPVSVKEATRRRVRQAAELKANHAIAYADAFAVLNGPDPHACGRGISTLGRCRSDEEVRHKETDSSRG